MINGLLETIKNYKGMNKGLDEVIEFITSKDLNALPLGLTIINKDKDITVNKIEYNGKKEDSGLAELHRHHLDLQLLLKGSEICYFDYYKDELESLAAYEYKADKDIIQYKVECSNKLVFNSNNFTMFTPTDIHSPGHYVNDETIIKLVFKIRI